MPCHLYRQRHRDTIIPPLSTPGDQIYLNRSHESCTNKNNEHLNEFLNPSSWFFNFSDPATVTSGGGGIEGGGEGRRIHG